MTTGTLENAYGKAATHFLYRVTTALHDFHHEPAQALRASIAHLVHFGYDRPTIALYDPAREEVRVELTHGLSNEEKRKGRFRKGEGIEGKVIEDGQVAVIPSMSLEPDFIDRTGARRDVDKAKTAFICAPITGLDLEVIATLSVDVPNAADERLNWDRRLLTTFAALVSATVIRWRDHLQDESVIDTRVNQLKARRLLRPKELIGRSQRIEDVFMLMDQVAPSDLNVLIRGENGTGKEVIARAIHKGSARSGAPFVRVSLGGRPDDLMERELFGFVHGEVSGAAQGQKGRLELANGGTVFLDEVADLSLEMQVKMLTVLQERAFTRIGDNQSRRLDVRFIASSRMNLEALIEQGTFRDDLFYRLNVFPIYVPALKERKTDITLLADFFVEKHAQQQGKTVTRISTPAIDLMCAYHWPGNVRELENCVERAVLLAHDGVVRDHHLPPTLQTGRSSGTTKQGSLETVVAAFEREVLIEAMKNAHGNMAAAARALETTPRILSYKLKKHGLHTRLAIRRRRDSE